MKQQCSRTDEQIEAVAVDSLEFFEQPEYEVEVALSQAQVLVFARACLDAAYRQATQLRQN